MASDDAPVSFIAMRSVSAAKPHGPPIEVYCDESLDRGGFDLIGGLWLTQSNARRLRTIIHGIREQYNHWYELKWTKATGRKLSPAYKELASKLTDQIMARRAAFHCLVIRRDQIDWKRHAGDKELGYYKFVHWLARKRIEPGESYVLTLDWRTTRKDHRLSELRDVLNHCGRKDHNLRHDCFREVRAKPSKKDDLLQAADVLLGAVGYHYARRHRGRGGSPAKNDLADRIALGIQRPSLDFASHRSEKRFNVWRWSPS